MGTSLALQVFDHKPNKWTVLGVDLMVAPEEKHLQRHRKNNIVSGPFGFTMRHLWGPDPQVRKHKELLTTD